MPQIANKTQPASITEQDLYLFNEGSHVRLYQILGAHLTQQNNIKGTFFAVWAPNATTVSVIGDFNQWQKEKNNLNPVATSGIWAGFIPHIEQGTYYKYHIVHDKKNYAVDKTDPFAFFNEIPPNTASVVWNLHYQWQDQEWMEKRKQYNAYAKPMSIYEIHLGSWQRVTEENNRPLTYHEIAAKLTAYVLDMGFTHVEFLPVMEHPFYGSWGYQTTGYFAPTSRYGSPQDFMYLIDYLHQHNIGVILDWVPSHFPNDEHGLAYFDGTHLFEHADPKLGFHPDWKSAIFNYGRHEVRSFLLSSALFWFDKYHIDGLRVDAVASMLYLDYSRKSNEWIPNRYGGRENIEAIDFLRRLNVEVYKHYPEANTIAEESTAWGMVSRPTDTGGLGFGFKWDMGWMHDTLHYLQYDPIYRHYHHGELTFRMLYAFTENFVLPLSHDEVVHGKGSLLSKMPGDDWQKFANLRLLLGYQFAQPGKKLLFMGSEFGQWSEWHHDQSLDWHLLEYIPHQGIKRWVTDLNRLYRKEAALHEYDNQPDGFSWVDGGDYKNSIICFLRFASHSNDMILIIVNCTPMTHQNYRVGVPKLGFWQEIANSDATEYDGSGQGNLGGHESSPIPYHNQSYSLSLIIPPLSISFFKYIEKKDDN